MRPLSWRSSSLAREAPVGDVIRVTDAPLVCLGQRTVLIRPDAAERCDPRFLHYCAARSSTSGRHARSDGRCHGWTPERRGHVGTSTSHRCRPPSAHQARSADLLGSHRRPDREQPAAGGGAGGDGEGHLPRVVREVPLPRTPGRPPRRLRPRPDPRGVDGWDLSATRLHRCKYGKAPEGRVLDASGSTSPWSSSAGVTSAGTIDMSASVRSARRSLVGRNGQRRQRSLGRRSVLAHRHGVLRRDRLASQVRRRAVAPH